MSVLYADSIQSHGCTVPVRLENLKTELANTKATLQATPEGQAEDKPTEGVLFIVMLKQRLEEERSLPNLLLLPEHNPNQDKFMTVLYRVRSPRLPSIDPHRI